MASYQLEWRLYRKAAEDAHVARQAAAAGARQSAVNAAQSVYGNIPENYPSFVAASQAAERVKAAAITASASTLARTLSLMDVVDDRMSTHLGSSYASGDGAIAKAEAVLAELLGSDTNPAAADVAGYIRAVQIS